ncbi:MAG: ATP-dependent ligase, partial [Myxococcaceae bacterium]|nr:ATP-dependent ligase [Myxococcaceae bacterium]
FALRFPRIAHIRDDKKPEEADTLDAVRALWEAQLASGHREDLTAKDRKPKATTPSPPKKGRKSGRRPDVRAKSKQLKLFDDD